MTEILSGDMRSDIYNQLCLQILKLEIEPGERLSESQLSGQMNAGRAMVRDALSRLVEEGYMVVYPQRGTEVTLIDIEKIRQAVFSHTVLEQAMIEEICKQGLSIEQLSKLEEWLASQKSLDESKDLFDFMVMEQRLHYLLASFCQREYSWEIFRTIDSDMLRVSYLQYSTFNYRFDMSSLTSWEHAQVEGRLLIDNLRRRDAEAACLICANHFNTILWNAGTLREIYPQFFSA